MVLNELIFHKFLLSEGVVILKELILTVSMRQSREGVVILNEVTFNSFDFERVRQS